jgi:hypothetical protein
MIYRPLKMKLLEVRLSYHLLQTNVLVAFEMFEYTTLHATQSKIPEDQNSQSKHCGNLTSLEIIVVPQRN